MTSKLNYYDVLAVLLPGVLVLAVVVLMQPDAFKEWKNLLPASLVTLLFTGLALVAGQIVHGIGSLIEPLLFATWGGRPSDRLLAGRGRGYLPAATGTRIRMKLEKKLEPSKPEPHELFLFALTLAGGEKGRVGIFNSLYAHHRSLFVASLAAAVLLLFSTPPKAFAELQDWLLGLAITGTLLFWWRARARGYYFAREVLLAAEKEL